MNVSFLLATADKLQQESRSILYGFPLDFTPVCSKQGICGNDKEMEWCSLRIYKKYEPAGFE